MLHIVDHQSAYQMKRVQENGPGEESSLRHACSNLTEIHTAQADLILAIANL
jgi:hypothetical protein